MGVKEGEIKELDDLTLPPEEEKPEVEPPAPPLPEKKGEPPAWLTELKPEELEALGKTAEEVRAATKAIADRKKWETTLHKRGEELNTKEREIAERERKAQEALAKSQPPKEEPSQTDENKVWLDKRAREIIMEDGYNPDSLDWSLPDNARYKRQVEREAKRDLAIGITIQSQMAKDQAETAAKAEAEAEAKEKQEGQAIFAEASSTFDYYAKACEKAPKKVERLLTSVINDLPDGATLQQKKDAVFDAIQNDFADDLKRWGEGAKATEPPEPKGLPVLAPAGGSPATKITRNFKDLPQDKQREALDYYGKTGKWPWGIKDPDEA